MTTTQITRRAIPAACVSALALAASRAYHRAKEEGRLSDAMLIANSAADCFDWRGEFPADWYDDEVERFRRDSEC
jgi:hypothetical protein